MHTFSSDNSTSLYITKLNQVLDCEAYTAFFTKHLQVHFAVNIKLISGIRPIKITDTDTSVPNTRGRPFGGSPQSKPGTIPKL